MYKNFVICFRCFRNITLRVKLLLLSRHLGVGLLGHVGILGLPFWRTPRRLLMDSRVKTVTVSLPEAPPSLMPPVHCQQKSTDAIPRCTNFHQFPNMEKDNWQCLRTVDSLMGWSRRAGLHLPLSVRFLLLGLSLSSPFPTPPCHCPSLQSESPPSFFRNVSLIDQQAESSFQVWALPLVETHSNAISFQLTSVIRPSFPQRETIIALSALPRHFIWAISRTFVPKALHPKDLGRESYLLSLA